MPLSAFNIPVKLFCQDNRHLKMPSSVLSSQPLNLSISPHHLPQLITLVCLRCNASYPTSPSSNTRILLDTFEMYFSGEFMPLSSWSSFSYPKVTIQYRIGMSTPVKHMETIPFPPPAWKQPRAPPVSPESVYFVF